MKKKISPEQHNLEQLERELERLRHYYINSPTIDYKVGDRVIRGNISESIVIEVLDNGKILKLHEKYEDHNYGKPIPLERDDYVAWMDVVPHDTFKFETEIAPDLNINFQQRDVEGLLTTYYSAGIDTNPDYQRGLVWSHKQKYELIESIFNCIDIGKFVLIELPFRSGKPNYEILDGKQRLNALLEFYESRWQFRGIYFSELNRHSRHHFESYRISYAQVGKLSQSQKYEYFLRLNTVGQPVEQAHLDKVYSMWKES